MIDDVLATLQYALEDAVNVSGTVMKAEDLDCKMPTVASR